MDIRHARESDLPYLPAIELSAASTFEGQDVPARLFTECSAPEAFKPNLTAGTLWVAEVDGVLGAFLSASSHGDRLHIDEFDVARAQQGKGLGRRMLATVVGWARANGFKCLSLTTFRNIPWNAPFYASAGFEDWPTEAAPPTIRQHLMEENARGLKDRCAMKMEL